MPDVTSTNPGHAGEPKYIRLQMAPLIVQIVTTLVARVRFGWRDAARIGIAVMFMFTAGSHFSALRYDLARMIPPPLTGALWLIYLTGILELAGAIGLLTRRWRRPAAWGLIALLAAMFPANVYAVINDVTFGGNPASALWYRAPLQVFWAGGLWWAAAQGNEMGTKNRRSGD
jgi:uncharacterized membrane protein